MLENVTLSSKKPSRSNNRKRSKVYDPSFSNKKKKVDNDSFCEENNVSEPNDQLAIIKKHLLLSSKKDLNKTMDEMCNELGLNKYVSEDDLSDDPESDNQDVPRSHDSVERCINKIFEGLDDYASFNPKGLGSTPKVQRKVYSAIDSSIKPTPGITSAYSRQKTILKPTDKSLLPRLDQSVYSTPYSEKTRISLGSNGLDDSGSKNSSRTPFLDKTNLLKTPEPCQSLTNFNVTSTLKTPTYIESTVQDSFYTPLRSTSRLSVRNSLSPGVVELSPEIKRTLLIGVACFVDVKTNKEDCSSSVALELISMGATVEKTFNKKVSHVIFKEGRPSTYLKAKKLGLVMVSVLWLEACKRERKMVDPSQYPPVNVEKYENISPSGKKIPSLKTIQRKLRKHLLREAGVLSADNKSKIRINWRKALTDIKARNISDQESSQGRLCTKKLDFNNDNLLNSSQIPVISISDSPECKLGQDEKENKNSTASSSDYQASPPAVRRNSAPAMFISERKKRKRKEAPITESQKMLTIDQLFAKQMTLNDNKRIKLDFKNDSSIGTQNSQSSRKRKLFNPEEAIVIIDTPDEKSTPPPITYEFPYKDEEETSNRRKTRTKSTSMKKIFKKMIVNKKPLARKSLTSLLEQDEGSASSSSRGSLTFFMDTKKVEPKVPKEPPSIVCTSLLPEQVRKVAYITGKLGVFNVGDKVSAKTTHLVTSAPRRTINLLKALVRGAWILHVDWIYKSEEAGHWLNEEEFELKTFSHAVTEMRRERQAFGSEFCSELFSQCGPIYVSKRSIPPCSDLTELIRLCKGRVINNPTSADFIIGGKAVEGESVLRLKEKWILDSITQNNLLDTGRYVIRAHKS